MSKKFVVCGVHGVGKSRICNKIIDDILLKHYLSKEGVLLQRYKNISIKFIPEQFREVVKDIPNFTKQTEEITLATYAKQLYLENLYTAQGKNILCDRSVLDTFVYYEYFNSDNLFNDDSLLRMFKDELNEYVDNRREDFNVWNMSIESAYRLAKNPYYYHKIYLIEPSDREIENDGFRLTDKKQQLEIHNLFLKYFKDFLNVEIINQEDAHKEEFIDVVIKQIVNR